MPPKKRTNGYKMPDPIPQGEILQDVNKRQWKLGPSIGKGGFGEIYSAQEVAAKKSNQYPYVVKIEPHTNGPLFVEMNFLLRNAKKEDVEEFVRRRKLKSLGMPTYVGSGSHEHNNEKYRFVVLEKFGSDIWKLFLENKREFPVVTVFRIGAQILDVLEYIHSRGYAHHDIKGANILLDLKDKSRVFLLDFGLASHYFTGKEFKPDPKKAHDGTLEYVSRDGHNGLQTRRGDLEILGYNLIQWLGCTLPWETDKSPPDVQKSKEEHMGNIPGFMKVCFGDKSPPDTITEYFTYLNTLNFDSEPDYKKLQKILANGIGTSKSPLTFKSSRSLTKRKSAPETPSSGKKPKLPRRKLDVHGNENENENPDEERSKNSKKAKPSEPKNGAVPKEEEQPREKAKKPKRTKQKDQEDGAAPKGANSTEDTNGYTAEMKRIREKMAASRKARGTKPKVHDIEKGGASTSAEGKTSRRKRNVVNYTEGETED